MVPAERGGDGVGRDDNGIAASDRDRDDRTVVAESRSSYEKYERCLAAAQAKGYVFEAAQARLPRPGNRMYMRP